MQHDSHVAVWRIAQKLEDAGYEGVGKYLSDLSCAVDAALAAPRPQRRLLDVLREIEGELGQHDQHVHVWYGQHLPPWNATKH